MSKCDIELQMPESVPAGGTLQGEVVVTVQESVETKALKLLVGWRTHGRGDRFRRIVTEQVLFAGELTAGEMRFPFAVSVPTGPLTFHGENINVEWFAAASVDLAWAVDPRVEHVFTLLRARTAKPYVFGSRRPLTGLAGSKPTPVADGCLTVILAGIVLFLAGALALAAAMAFQRSGRALFVPLAIFLLAFGSMWAWALYRVAGQKWANRRAGDVKVSASKVDPAAGELVKLDLEFTPNRDLQLNDIALVLTCTEVAISGSGTSRSTYTNTILEDRTVLADSTGLVSRRVPIRFTQLLQIPPDAPPSFVADDNEVLWTIAIRIDIQNAIDWQDAFTLAVRP